MPFLGDIETAGMHDSSLLLQLLHKIWGLRRVLCIKHRLEHLTDAELVPSE